MKRSLTTLLSFLTLSMAAWGHHGGTSTSQGPGTPLETNSPLTLPKGGTVVYTRAEIASFKKFMDFDPNNVDSFQFYQMGVSHGLTDYLTATAIVPYTIKSQDGLGSTRGFGDGKVLLTLGFNYAPGEGLQLNGEEDTAVNLGTSDKTYFGVLTGISMPTGRYNIDLGAGVDSGQQPGFGTPTLTAGLSMTRGVTENFNIAADVSADFFLRRKNGDKFGNEFRANLAGVLELYADQEAFVRRLDGVLELNYLQISRDETARISELGTGGRILYLTPGVRMQVGDFNVGAGVKLPIASSLNERSLQQGSEGLEKYRLLLTVSTFF
jgi:hypothetical protein